MSHLSEERRILEIIACVSGLPEPERGARLRAECAGDARLLSKVETLLSGAGLALAEQVARAKLAEPLVLAAAHDPTFQRLPDDAGHGPATGHARAVPGKELAGGRFKVLRWLGQGGMGAVYEARDRERGGERIALKVVLGADATNLQRFKHEFRALQDLEHPNLVRLGELHEAGGDWFITMELVSGTDLLSYVREDGARFDELRLRACFQQVATGLRALHVAGKVHRDIKPSNVLVTPEGRVVVLDFGLVIDRSEARMSTEGNVVGTVAYMAPEQASATPIGPSADWYAFGVMLYEALTGTLPFTGGNLKVLMDKLSVTPVAPSALAPDVRADLDELCVALLHVDPTARPHGEEVMRRLGVRTRSDSLAAKSSGSLDDAATFVGRRAEYAELEQAFAHMLDGRTLTVSVEGPSGIGKSALVKHFTQQLPRSKTEVMVLRGRCYERETTRFKALDAVIDALATSLMRLPRDERHQLVPRNATLLRQLFPVLGRVDAIARAPRPPARPRDAVDERRWMFASLRELLAKVGERWPLVIVIDDIHWADADSLELLRVLLDASQEPPPRLLLLVTARLAWGGFSAHERTQPWPVELRMIELAPLPADDATQLARTLLVQHGTPNVDVQALVEESRGHPFFVAELARHASVLSGDGAAPVTLDSAIWDRARSLPDVALDVLRILAVEALPLPLHVLSRATHLPLSELERQLGVLRFGGFIRSSTDRDQRCVEPYHDRVRESVRDQLTAEQRRELHGTLATLLEHEQGVDLEHVAQHYLDAGERDKACELFERAARRAEEGFAFERAAQLYQLQLTLRAWSQPEQSELHRKAGAALARAGKGRAAADAYFAAVDGAEEVARVHLRYLSATQLLRGGHITDGLARLEQLLGSVGLSASSGRLGAMVSFVWQAFLRRVAGFRVRLRDPSMVTAQELAQADALWSVAAAMIWVDGVLAAPMVARTVRAALATGQRSRMVRALGGEAMFLSALGPGMARTAARSLALMYTAAGEERSADTRGFIALAEGSMALNQSEFKKAYDRISEASSLLEGCGADVQWERAWGHIQRQYAQLYMGRIREAVFELPEAIADAEARQDLFQASILRLNATIWCALTAKSGDLKQARDAVEEAYRPWRSRETGFMHATYVTQSMLHGLFEQRGEAVLGCLAEARTTLKRSGSMRMDFVRHNTEFYAGTALLQIYLRQREVSVLSKVERLSASLQKGRPYYAGLGTLLGAQLALARGQQGRAFELAQAAQSRLGEAGAATYAHASAVLVGTMRGDDGQLRRQAHTHFQAEGVSDPEQVLRALAPLSVA